MFHRHTTQPHLVINTWEQWTKDDVLTSCKNYRKLFTWCQAAVQVQPSVLSKWRPGWTSRYHTKNQKVLKDKIKQWCRTRLISALLCSAFVLRILSNEQSSCRLWDRWTDNYVTVHLSLCCTGREIDKNTSGMLTNSAVWHDIQQHFVIISCSLYSLLLFESLH